MATNPAGCIELLREGTHPRISVSDPGTGKSVILLNPECREARKVRMDGCLAPAGSKAADFVVSLTAVVDLIVELKGKNVERALQQIESTHAFWQRHVEHVAGQPIGALIVCKEVPVPLKFKKAQEQFRSKGCILRTSKPKEERSFSDFLAKR